MHGLSSTVETRKCTLEHNDNLTRMKSRGSVRALCFCVEPYRFCIDNFLVESWDKNGVVSLSAPNSFPLSLKQTYKYFGDIETQIIDHVYNMRFKWCSDRDVPKYQFEDAYHQPIRMKQGKATVTCRYNAHEVSTQTLEHFRSSKCLGSVTLTYKGFELSESDIYPLYDLTDILVKNKSTFLEHITEQTVQTTHDWDETEPDIYPTDVENVCESSNTMTDSSRRMQSGDWVESPPSERCNGLHETDDVKFLHAGEKSQTHCFAADSLDTHLNQAPRVCEPALGIKENTDDNFSCLATLPQEKEIWETEKEINMICKDSYGNPCELSTEDYNKKEASQSCSKEFDTESKQTPVLAENNNVDDIKNIYSVQRTDSVLMEADASDDSTMDTAECQDVIKSSKGYLPNEPLETFLLIAPEYFLENKSRTGYLENTRQMSAPIYQHKEPIYQHKNVMGHIQFEQSAQKKRPEDFCTQARKAVKKQQIPAKTHLSTKKHKIISTPSYVSSLEVSKVRTNRDLDDMYKQTIDCGYESQFEKIGKLRLGPSRR